MKSSRNSVEKKRSSNWWKDIDQSVHCHQKNEGIPQVLKSSWVRRLNSKLISPVETINDEEQASFVPLIPVNSSSTTGFGATQVCNRTTIQTDKPQTLTSITNGHTTYFLNQLLKTHNENHSSKTDPVNCTFPGFGSFQLKNDCSEIQGRKGDLGQVVKEKREQQKIKKNPFLQRGRFSKSHNKTLVTDDQNRIPLSPSSSTILSGPKKSLDQKTTVSEYISGSLEEDNDKKLINLNSKALINVEDQRQHFSVDQWPMYRVFHGRSSLSRTRSTTSHESRWGDDDDASRICEDSRLTHGNVVLNQDEIETPSPACRNEILEPTSVSSFWEMNSFQRADMVSSTFRACKTNNRKRTLGLEEFVSLKSKKPDLQDK